MAAATAVFTRGGKSGVREWEEKEHICKEERSAEMGMLWLVGGLFLYFIFIFLFFGLFLLLLIFSFQFLLSPFHGYGLTVRVWNEAHVF